MNFFKEQISKFNDLTCSANQTVFPYSENKWEDAGRNEIVMQKEALFELQGIGTELFTSESIGADEIIVMGNDLNAINENIQFARVSVIQLDDTEDEQKAHDIIRKIEYIKYHYFPKGYMVRTNSQSNAENVRVSKSAIKNGVSFEKIGNLLISKYKENPAVKSVKIYFITEKSVDYASLMKLAEKNNEIITALDHVIRDLNLDCDVCKLKAICDEVEGMRELHFKNVMK